MKTLFRPFEQAGTSTTRRCDGTGMGLAISEHLTQLMGGYIKVSSQPAHGIHFTIVLPMQALSVDANLCLSCGYCSVTQRSTLP